MSIIIWKKLSHAVLFLYELRGQLSDGYWENSRPNNHWKWVSLATVQQDQTCDKEFDIISPIFYINRKYNFNNKQLIDIVGERMLAYVRLGMCRGFKAAAHAEDIVRIQDFISGAGADIAAGRDPNKSYWCTTLQRIKEMLDMPEQQNYVALNCAAQIVVKEMESMPYTLKDLRADLREMSDLVNSYRY